MTLLNSCLSQVMIKGQTCLLWSAREAQTCVFCMPLHSVKLLYIWSLSFVVRWEMLPDYCSVNIFIFTPIIKGSLWGSLLKEKWSNTAVLNKIKCAFLSYYLPKCMFQTKCQTTDFSCSSLVIEHCSSNAKVMGSHILKKICTVYYNAM